MALQMKESCESCARELQLNSAAYICSYECTFCEACASGRSFICPNCNGNLTLRPTRRSSSEAECVVD
jgi:uncharacterized protein